MTSRENARKGKATDLSTPWSEWIWSDDGQYWYASRYNSGGEAEYEYRYPEGLNQHESTPRSTTLPIPQDDSTLETVPNSSANYITTPYSPSNDHTTSQYQAHGGWSTSEIGRSFERMNLGNSPEYLEPDYSKELVQNSNDIYNAGEQSAGNRELDKCYRVIHHKDQKKFFRVGRVFSTLWTEPARVSEYQGHNEPSEHISEVWLGGKVFTEIRRFVIVQEGYGNCLCSPIHTYGDQATLKPNLPDVGQHAIIYTSSKPPDEYYYTADDQSNVYENLNKDPIKVNSEVRGRIGDLGTSSRINYAKVYTIEHYNRVCNIGMVDKSSLQSLQRSALVQRSEAVERPKVQKTRSDHKKPDKRRGKSHH